MSAPVQPPQPGLESKNEPAGVAEDNLSPHVEDAVNALADLYLESKRETARLQRAIDRTVDWLGRPWVGASVVVAILVWAGAIFLNFGVAGAHTESFDWLELIAALMALIVAVLILVVQRRENLLAQRREQLALELALLSERKSAKIIALLEELRRDAPTIPDREDKEVEAMAEPADTQTVLAALDQRTDKKPKGEP